MHFVIYLPKGFYAAIAATIVETIQAVNDQLESDLITYDFIASEKQSVSKSGIFFNCKTKPTRSMNVLILLAGMKSISSPLGESFRTEENETAPLIRAALKEDAVIAATCGAPYLLANYGILNNKKATISWWLKNQAMALFPEVHWKASQILIKDENIYTSGGGFSGMEMITTILENAGFAAEIRKVRKLLVFPPTRQFQSPYEFPLEIERSPLETELNTILKSGPENLNTEKLATALGMSSRTMSRRFKEELATSPGKWIQQKRIELAISLLEETEETISEICYKVGYEDLSSFSRLFVKTTGMSPTEYRRQIKARVIG